MEVSPLDQERSAPSGYGTQPAGSSRPPSSAGSTIDDPDMTDDETKISGEDGDGDDRSQNLDAATPGADANPGSPRPAMDKLAIKKHKLETPSKRGSEKPSRSSSARKARKSKGGSSSKTTLSWVHEGPANGDTGSVGDDDSVKLERSARRGSDIDAKNAATGAATVVGTRRQANGTIGSVYSGNKIRHLKKDDGVPLWRKDIQY